MVIQRLRQVADGLWRGSAPSPKDLMYLKDALGINKIVSLDYSAGKVIENAVRLLGMEQVLCPIDLSSKGTLAHFLRKDLKDLLITGGPTFVHCIHGRDRTGFAIALFRCLYQGWSCEDALNEALSLGFGTDCDPRVIHLYMKIINKACGCGEDINEAYDITSNVRELPGNYDALTIDEWQQISYDLAADPNVRNFPSARVDDINDDFHSRDRDYDQFYENAPIDLEVPQVGSYDTMTSSLMGQTANPVSGGYI